MVTSSLITYSSTHLTRNLHTCAFICACTVSTPCISIVFATAFVNKIVYFVLFPSVWNKKIFIFIYCYYYLWDGFLYTLYKYDGHYLLCHSYWNSIFICTGFGRWASTRATRRVVSIIRLCIVYSRLRSCLLKKDSTTLTR